MNGENVAEESDETDAVPVRRVSMTVTGYLRGRHAVGGWFDMQSRPDGGQQYSIPEFAVDEASVTDLPPEQLTRDDWSEITGTLVARLGKGVGGQLAAQWMGIALAVQQARSEEFRRRPGKTIEQLAAEQGVKPVESIDDLAGPGDIPAGEMDAFLAAIHEPSDPRRNELEDLLATIDLYIGRFVIKQLTTEQKNLYADSVDAAHVRLAAGDPAYGEPSKVERWWDE